MNTSTLLQVPPADPAVVVAPIETGGAHEAAAADVRLRDRALDGDRAAMATLVKRLLPVVQTRVGSALLRRRGQARGRSLRQEVEDLVQEVFEALLERQGRVLRSWQPARGMSLTSFVGLVAEREAGMILRTGKRNPFTEDPNPPDDLAALPGAARDDVDVGTQIESRDILHVILASLQSELSPQGIRVFHLLFVEERSVEETMAHAGLSRDAVYAWRSRLAKRARAIHDHIVAAPAPDPARDVRRAP